MYEIFLIALVVSLLFIAFTRIYPGGIIVPGYLILFVDQPLRLLGTLLASVVIWLLYRLASRWLILFGQRRFVFFILLSALISYAVSALLPQWYPEATEIRIIGWIIPGLIANNFEKQGVWKTIASMVGIVAVLFVVVSLLPRNNRLVPEKMEAARIMDHTLDVMENRLIGPEWSGITTTLGDLESKRTSLNPNLAALMVHLLDKAGVRKGDTIALGSSGSFPGLLIASLSAARSMNLCVRPVISIGSSTYGANDPDFTIWDLYLELLNKHIIDYKPVAISWGGEDDTGSEFNPEIRTRIKASVDSLGIPLIEEKNLVKNRAMRDSLYFQGRPGSIQAFINTGGGYANLGTSTSILDLRPGLVKRVPRAGPEQQGMIHSMISQGIPVIHLLNLKGLARKYGLPWNPLSRPEISKHSVQFTGKWKNLGS